MNKVTTINLSGRAFQMEEHAYEKLHAYLQSARHELNGDPDKEEIMQDFEQAIADKCDELLTKHKNVITTVEIENIIASMGKVEAGSDTNVGSEDSKSTKGSKSESGPKPHGEVPKRLYLLQEGSYLGGVCTGLAAYFKVDVTLVRIVFIILAFVTSGFWILVYLLMMMIIPTATTPEQKAELRGERFTAQDVINRAKQKYADLSDREHWEKMGKDSAPAIHAVGAVTVRITRIVFGITATVIATCIAALSCAWVALTWWLLMGNLHFTDQLHTIPLWAVVAAGSLVYAISVLPFIVVGQIFMRLAQGKQVGQHEVRWYATAAILWVLASGALIGLGAVYQSRIHDYQQTHAYIDIDKHHVCINSQLCYGSNPDAPATRVYPVPSNPIDLQTMPYMAN